MKDGRYIFLLMFVLILLCFGCSRHRFIRHNELINEIAKLPSGSKISICDTMDTKYDGFFAKLIQIPTDSTHILVIETAKEKEKYQFTISSINTQNSVKSVNIPYKADATKILIGGLSGMIGGSVSGIFIGDAVKGKYDDTLAPRFLGGIIGSITGFITGAVIVEAITGEDVFVLKDNSHE